MEKSAEDYFTSGNDKLVQGDLDGAIDDFTEAISLNHNFADTYHNRGVAKMQKGDLDEAIADFNKAIELNPKHTNAYNNRGIAKMQKRDLDEAIADFTEAIRLNPNFADAYYNRGNAKGQKGDLKEAIVDFTKVIEINPNHKYAYRNRGNAKKQKGDLSEAIDDFTKTIILDPNDATNYRNRGFARGEKGDFEEAIDDFNKAIELAPNDATDYRSRGIARLEKGDYEEAIDDFTKAIGFDPNNVIDYRFRGIAMGQKENFEGAIVDFTKAIDLDPSDALSHFYRGNAKRRSDLEGAIADYTEAINIKDDFATAYYHRGLTKSERGNKKDLDEAIADFDQANKKDKNIATHFPFLFLAKQTQEILDWKDKEKRKLFLELFQRIIELKTKFAKLEMYKKKIPMHFTDLNTLRNIAQGKRFRLYNSSLMHDKNEGKIFFEMLYKDKENQEVNIDKVDKIKEAFSVEHNTHTFIGSFVMDSDVYDGDNLMWCVYGQHKGKESLGCAFVFKNKTFSSHISSEVLLQALISHEHSSFEDEQTDSVGLMQKSKKMKNIRVQNVKNTSNFSPSEKPVKYEECFLYPVVYSDYSNINKNIKKEIKKILKNIGISLDEIHKAIEGLDKQLEIQRLVGGMLDLVRFLFKHKLYSRESEARLVVWRIKDSKVTKKDPDPYVECPKLDFKRIILGPAVKNDEAWKDWLKKKGISEDKVRKSMDPISPMPK